MTQLFRRVARAWSRIDGGQRLVDFFAFMLAGAVAVAGQLGWIDEDVANIVAVWIFGLGIAMLTVLMIRAPWLLLDEAEDRIDGLVRVPDVRIELRDPLPWTWAHQAVGGTWPCELIRLVVRHDGSTTAAFMAAVTATTGLPVDGPEDPWYVPWRHSRNRAAELHASVPEMLKLGLAATSGGVPIVFNVIEYDGEQEVPHPVGSGLATGKATVTVTIWHVVTGCVAARCTVAFEVLGPHTQVNLVQERPLLS